MIITLSLLLLLVVATVIFMRTEKFGKQPTGERLARIQQSPNYKDGAFENLSHTPAISEDANYTSLLLGFFFKRVKKPTGTLPTIKTDLMALDPRENVIVWMGHSTYFMQLDGKKILVDPVLSGYASPLPFTTRAFNGSDVYTTDDIPPIDYLFITHDHWDHMDHTTLVKLRSKINTVICGLGNGAHLEHWGFDAALIHEEDWNQTILLDEGFTVYVTPARHFSGRGFKRNQSLWASYVLTTPTANIFIGGDSGYDTHFVDIGKTFGPFDVVLLENGQYDKQWKYIHMMPHEVIRAAEDLQARALLPVHSGKFTLGNHNWDEPLATITQLPKSNGLKLLTPMIGEAVLFKDSSQQFKKWWVSAD